MSSRIPTPSYSTRTDYGQYRELLTNHGYGEMIVTSATNGGITQQCVTFSESSSSIFMPGMFYANSKDNLIAVSGLIRCMGSAKFRLPEDVPNVRVLPYEFDYMSLLEEVNAKYLLKLYVLQVIEDGGARIHKLSLVINGEQKMFTCVNDNDYEGRSIIARNALNVYMRSLECAPVVVFKRDWFNSTNPTMIAAYNWFFNYVMPIPVVSGFTQTIQGKNYLEDEGIITVAYPGKALLTAMILEDSMVIYQTEGYGKVSIATGDFEAGKQKKKIRSSYDPVGSELVLLVAKSGDTPVQHPFIYNVATRKGHMRNESWAAVVEAHQAECLDEYELRIEPEVALHKVPGYKRMHDEVQLNVEKVVHDMIVVAGHTTHKPFDVIGVGIYKLFKSYGKAAAKETVSYRVVKNFMTLFGQAMWFTNVEKLLHAGWYLSALTGRKNFPISTITPMLDIDDPWINARAYNLDAIATFTEGVLTLENGSGEGDIRSLLDDVRSVFCGIETFGVATILCNKGGVPIVYNRKDTCKHSHAKEYKESREQLPPRSFVKEEGQDKILMESPHISQRMCYLQNVYGEYLNTYRRGAHAPAGLAGGPFHRTAWWFFPHGQQYAIKKVTPYKSGYLVVGPDNSAQLSTVIEHFDLVTCRGGFVIQSQHGKYLTMTKKGYVYFGGKITLGSLFVQSNARQDYTLTGVKI